ncbi:MAG: SpoIIE family protein phosphatase [Planctomycetaceae bacterium]
MTSESERSRRVAALAVSDAARSMLGMLKSPKGVIAIHPKDGGMNCTVIDLTEPVVAQRFRRVRIADGAKSESLLSPESTAINNSPHRLPGGIEVPRSVTVSMVDPAGERSTFIAAGRQSDYDDSDAKSLQEYARILISQSIPWMADLRGDEDHSQLSFATQSNGVLSETEVAQTGLRQGLLSENSDTLSELSRAELVQLLLDAKNSLLDRDRTIQQLHSLSGETGAIHADFRLQHQAILNNSPACIYIKGVDGRYEFINRQFEGLFHLSLAEIVGKDDFDVFSRDMAEAFRKNDQHVAATGEVLQIEEVAPHDDGPHTYLSVKFPIFDTQGRVRSVAGISTDITPHVRMKQHADDLGQRLTLILDSVADGVIGLDREGRLTFMNAAAELMLGWAESELRGEMIDTILLRSTVGGRWISQESPVISALREGIVFLSDDDVFRTKSGGEIPVEYVCSPIISDGETSGIVISFRDNTEHLENERAKREAAEARAKIQAIEVIQRDLFATNTHALPGFDIFARIWPATLVSGDFYDFAKGDDGKLLVTVGDACGHDLAAAIRMVETRALLHAYLDFQLPLDELLRRINNRLMDDPKGRFVSVTIAQLDPANREMNFLGAGHDAVIVRKDGSIETLSSTGMLLGILLNAKIEVRREKLAPGDIIVFATDGVTEATNGNNVQFGRERLINVIRQHADESAQKITGAIYDAIASFSGGAHAKDDITIAVVRSLD